jgi:hypothetical protein
MKTKLTKKQIEIEIAKVNLFNSIYGEKLETKIFDNKKNDWVFNGVTLAEHIEKENLYEHIETNKPTIYAIIRRVSPNGMNRQISFFAISTKSYWKQLGGTVREYIKDTRLVDITYNFSLVLDEKEPFTNSNYYHVIKVSGAGMDMVFHSVYTLSSILFRGVDGLEDIDRRGYLLQHQAI